MSDTKKITSNKKLSKWETFKLALVVLVLATAAYKGILAIIGDELVQYVLAAVVIGLLVDQIHTLFKTAFAKQ